MSYLHEKTVGISLTQNSIWKGSLHTNECAATVSPSINMLQLAMCAHGRVYFLLPPNVLQRGC